jgi:Spy/CpxP family protein refolding chaperone
MENAMKHLLLLTMILSTAAFAQPRRGWDDRPMRGIREMQKLDLTDDQRKQVDKLHSDLQKKQIALRAKIQAIRIDVRDAFREAKPDRGKIESKVNDITKAQGELKTNHLAFWFDVNKILTAEQQKVWREAPMMMCRGRGDRLRGEWPGRLMGGGRGMMDWTDDEED